MVERPLGTEHEAVHVLVDGQMYEVPDRTGEDLRSAIRDALQQGSILELSVSVAIPTPPEGTQEATLYLHGARLASVAVVTFKWQERPPVVGQPTQI